MNQPYTRVNQPYATLTLASALREMFGVQLYKNNARALLSRILSILKIGCSMRVVYAECMNYLYSIWRLGPYDLEVVVVLRSPIHANEPSEYNGMLYRTSNRVLNNGIKVIILICMDGTSQYHHHRPRLGTLVSICAR